MNAATDARPMDPTDPRINADFRSFYEVISKRELFGSWSVAIWMKSAPRSRHEETRAMIAHVCQRLRCDEMAGGVAGLVANGGMTGAVRCGNVMLVWYPGPIGIPIPGVAGMVRIEGFRAG